MRINDILVEFASPGGGNGGNYLKALAAAWYNMDIEMLQGLVKQGKNALDHRINVQQTIEKMLERGIHCGDGQVRKYSIGYNADFDGVEIQSDDHYEHADTDDAGRDIDSRTGEPWGPYDVVEFSDDDLSESQGVAEEGYGTHPSQRVDPRTGKKYIPPKSPLGKGVAEGLGKDIKRLATGKDVKSRAGQEIAKSQDASMKGDTKTSKKHFDRYDKLDKLANKDQGVAEGNQKPEPPEADYGDDYQAMVARVKKLAGLGPLKTVYDPAKRVYRNMPTATQPKK